MQHEDDLTSRAREYESVQVTVGTVGWNDRDEHFEKGNPNGAPGERHTLVFVTLYSGKDPSERNVRGKALGRKIICALSGGMFRIPKKGTIVYVIVPAGMEESPGAPLIIATREDDPPVQFEDDRAVISFGDDTHIVLRGKSVTMQDGPGRFLAVGTPRTGGTPGVQIRLPDGTGAVWQDGAIGLFARSSTLLQMNTEKIEIWQKGADTCCLKMGAGEFFTVAPVIKMKGFCYLGMAPVAANKAATYPLAIGVPPPSASVVISLL